LGITGFGAGHGDWGLGLCSPFVYLAIVLLVSRIFSLLLASWAFFIIFSFCLFLFLFLAGVCFANFYFVTLFSFFFPQCFVSWVFGCRGVPKKKGGAVQN